MTLETERLILRPFTEDDAADVFEYLHEPVAARAFLDYLFTQKGARRIYAYTEDYNVSSQKLCQKLGMRKEGEFKEFVSFIKNPDGTPLYENTWQYAILKKEWKV